MRNQHSLEEIAEIHRLLEDIKGEYEQGIRAVLQKNNPTLFGNPHTIPKLKKIQINHIKYRLPKKNLKTITKTKINTSFVIDKYCIQYLIK